MKLAVSNIAWSPQDRLAAYDILHQHSITGLEIAPGLFLSGADDPFAPDATTLAQAKKEIAASDLQLVSMQSLLFGVQGAALFEGPEALSQLKKGMIRAIDLAEQLGIENLVFGSPQQRNIPAGMTAQDATALAVEVFTALGDRAAAAGTKIAMEFNPAAYGTNFLTHAEQAIAFVAQVDHPAVTLNFDIGAMYMNEAFENIDTLIPGAISQISHVHISAPFLAPAPANDADIARVLRLLRKANYAHWTSIEMKAPEGGLVELETYVARLATQARKLEGQGS